MGILVSADTAARLQKHFQKDLLAHAVLELRLNEFAKQVDLPQKAGSKTIKFGRKREANQANVQVLTEGNPGTLQKHKIDYEYVEVTLQQYGDVYEQSDIVSYIDLFNTLKDSVGTMGEEAALKADSVTRDVIVSGITLAAQKRYAQGLASYAALKSATTTAGALIGADLLKAATQLRVNRAPKFGGDYVAVIPPQGSYDFFNDPKWVDVSKYAAAKQIFKGELGYWYGVRIVEAGNPFVESSAEDGTEGAFNDSDLANGIYRTLVFGKDAFGVAKLAGTNSPWKPNVIINSAPDKSDPLNQITQIGYKLFWASVLLNQKFVVSVSHKTTFA